MTPGGSYDNTAAVALLETSTSAIEYLVPLLDNQSVARLFGSESATTSSYYQFRRADFAYRYILLIHQENVVRKSYPSLLGLLGSMNGQGPLLATVAHFSAKFSTDPIFDANPKERDKLIARLKAQLSKKQ